MAPSYCPYVATYGIFSSSDRTPPPPSPPPFLPQLVFNVVTPCLQVYVATGNNYKVPPEYTECQLDRSTTTEECGLPSNYVSLVCTVARLVPQNLADHQELTVRRTDDLVSDMQTLSAASSPLKLCHMP